MAALDQANNVGYFPLEWVLFQQHYSQLKKGGDHVLVLNNVYGPTLDYLNFMERYGISFDVYSLEEISQLEQLVKQIPKLFILNHQQL